MESGELRGLAHKDAGKTLNKKVAAKPKTTINTEGLAYRPSASTKPQNPNTKPTVQTNPSQQRQQNVQIPKPKVITDSMSTVLDKYAIGDTSPIMSMDVFQDIVTKQNQEKQAKLELLQRQLEASQTGTSNPNPTMRKQPSILSANQLHTRCYLSVTSILTVSGKLVSKYYTKDHMYTGADIHTYICMYV
jgi:hypothetical protein